MEQAPAAMPATAWMCGGGRFLLLCAGSASTASGDCTALLSDARIDACLRANCDESVWHYMYFLAQ